MSVVVRMEMPKSCYDCEIRDDKAYCPICGATLVGYKRSRHENCPIVCQLPEGHGRLVDAAVLKNKNMRKPRGVSSYDYGAMATVFMDMINDTPTIVTAEAERSET